MPGAYSRRLPPSEPFWSTMAMPLVVRLPDSEVEAIDGAAGSVSSGVEAAAASWKKWVPLGRHRHALMTCIGFAYLQPPRLKAAGRGKKLRCDGPPPQPSLP